MQFLQNCAKNTFLKKCAKICIAIDRYLDTIVPLLLLLLLVVVLRIPNFTEPYWYGDEAIYLTIGHSLSQGALLYTDIVDHKTPLIYYFAMVPHQFWFRVLLLTWMLIATTAFYIFAQRLFHKVWVTTLATFIFVVLTSFPWLEGNIPNGELFVMGFILVGAALLSYTKSFDFWISDKMLAKTDQNQLTSLRELATLFGIGGLFGLGILTKVPALFDVLAISLIFIFLYTNQVLTSVTLVSKTTNINITLLKTFCIQIAVVFAGIVAPILLSIAYYTLRGSISDYVAFGLLYNFHYAGSWQLTFDSNFLTFFFSMPGKFTIATFFILCSIMFKKWISAPMQLLVSWFSLALFASLLSNRPYPHYFLQVVPPLALLLSYLAYHDFELLQKVRKRIAISMREKTNLIFTYTLGVSSIAILIGVLYFLNVGFYPTLSYYQRTFNYYTGNLTTQKYYQKFSSRMKDNYEAASIIVKSDDPYLFIWGTNPELYALTKKQPVGRFTVSFHIKDLGLYEETMLAVEEYKPQFIVIMKNERETLSGLEDLLRDHYMLNANFSQFELWKRMP